MWDTPARFALLRLQQVNGVKQVEIADQLRITQPNVSNWSRGLSRPNPHHREMLEVLYGIPRSDWLTLQELDALQRARASVESPDPEAA